MQVHNLRFRISLYKKMFETKGYDLAQTKKELVILVNEAIVAIESSLYDNKALLLRFLNRVKKIYSNKIDLENIVITKDNIHLHYEFMSDEDLKTNHKILNTLFNSRYNKVEKELNKVAKRSDIHVSLTDSFVIEPNGKSFDDENYRAFVGLQAFGVKDTLKPIDEYIADIKASEEYKAYIA